MKIDRISYTHTYQIGLAQWQKIGMEASVDETDNIQESLAKLEQESHNYHRISNPQLYKNGNEALVSRFEPVIQKDSKEAATQRIINQINQCSDEIVLKSFALIAKNNSEVQEAYNNKLKSFNNGLVKH